MFIHNSRLTTSFEMLQIDLGVKPDLSITGRFKNTPVGMGLDVAFSFFHVIIFSK